MGEIELCALLDVRAKGRHCTSNTYLLIGRSAKEFHTSNQLGGASSDPSECIILMEIQRRLEFVVGDG